MRSRASPETTTTLATLAACEKRLDILVSTSAPPEMRAESEVGRRRLYTSTETAAKSLIALRCIRDKQGVSPVEMIDEILSRILSNYYEAVTRTEAPHNICVNRVFSIASRVSRS